MTSSDGETNQGGTLFKGGHYRLEKGFDRGYYSRGYIIEGRTLIKEIRYLVMNSFMENNKQMAAVVYKN